MQGIYMQFCSLNNYNNKNNIFFGKRIPIKVFGEVSQPFVDEIKTGINLYPHQVTSKIQKASLVDEIRIAPKHSDAFPEFPSVQEFFRKTNDTICNGFAGVLNNEKGVPFLKFISLSQLRACSADRGVIGHELGHKADNLLEGTIGVPLSQTESFKAVVQNDLSKITEELKSKVLKKKAAVHFMNADVCRVINKKNSNDIKLSELGEIFADCAAANTTGTQAELKSKTKIMKTFFPKSYEYVQKYLYLMGMR